MKILITGAAGFIGSNVANYLHEKHTVLAIDNLKFGNIANLNRQVNFGNQGFEDVNEHFLQKFDVLIHLACDNIIYAQDHPIETFKTNALDTIELFEKFKGYIIYTSTASVYGQANILPTPEDAEKRASNAYSQSKLIAEKYLEKRGNYTTLRLSNVFGENQRPDNPYSGVIGKFIDCAKNDKPFHVYGDGSATRDYTHVSDVVRAIEMVLDKPYNDVYNISGQCEMSVLELIYEIAGVTGCKTSIHYDHNRLIDKIDRRSLDISKAKAIGWKPIVSIEEGLIRLI